LSDREQDPRDGRERALEALREAEARLRQIIDNIPWGTHTYELDANDRLVFVAGNPAADRILGVDHRRYVGMSIETAFPSLIETEVPSRYKLVADEGGRWEKELVQYQDERVSGAFEVIAFQTGPRRMTAFFRDITEKKRAEEERARLEGELRQAGKMEALGRLAGGVAHDFNNLLTGILGHLELALLELPAAAPGRDGLLEVRRAAESAAALTGQLLAFSRKRVVEPRVLDLNERILALHKMLARLIGEHVELRLVLPPGLGRVRIDPGQLEQILVNLAVNARDAMPDGGKLCVETGEVELGAPGGEEGPPLPPGRYVRLTVADTGCGIAEELQARVFEPFFTTKPHGQSTGLGLSTVLGAVRQAGGDVRLRSTPGEGSTFDIFLPRLQQEPEPLAARPELDAARGGQETVLVVEDDPHVRALAVRVLERFGYRVLSAADGAAACALAERTPAPLHLLLTDVIMPGMNGRQLAGEIRARHPETRVLFTSGYLEDDVFHHGVLEDGLHFVPKPYSPQELARKVREVLEG